MNQIEINQLKLRYTDLRIMDLGRVDRLMSSLAREEQRSPVLVTPDMVLVDGYHRVRALQQLGRDLVCAVIWDVSPPEALILSWRLERGRKRSAIEEGWMLSELVHVHHRSLAALVVQTQRSKSWVSERLGLVHALPESVQEAVRSSKIPPNGAMKTLVPFARADRDACAALVAALDGPVTVREIAQLYRAWRNAVPEVRQRIVANPMLFLKTEEAVSATPANETEQLVRDLENIANSCRRARRKTNEGTFPRGNDSATLRAWTQASEAFRSLQKEVRLARS